MNSFEDDACTFRNKIMDLTFFADDERAFRLLNGLLYSYKESEMNECQKLNLYNCFELFVDRMQQYYQLRKAQIIKPFYNKKFTKLDIVSS